MGFVAWKNSLTVVDAIILILIYIAYLTVLSRIAPESHETIEDLERIPRAIVTAPRGKRIAAITLLFIAGGILIYFMAEPFLGSLLALSTAMGVPSFLFIQWIAPLVSEFPEKVSAFYWARTVQRAPMALMNMVSSNINQWTMLTAMLPIVYSLSRGEVSPIPFDDMQKVELLMTLGQSLIGMMFLLNMELIWWEASILFLLFVIPFGHTSLAVPITIVYFAWAAIELGRMIASRHLPLAITRFVKIWRAKAT
jgi:cation:H+ antiporter